MLKLVRVATLIVCLTCLTRVCAYDAEFYDGVFARGSGAVSRWELPMLRGWLWRHWHSRSPATAIMHSVTVEGEGFESEYSVAKDSFGNLYLSIHTTGWERPGGDGTGAEWRDDWLIAYSVCRTKEAYQPDWPGKAIQHSRPLPARRYVLELRDKQRNVLTHL